MIAFPDENILVTGFEAADQYSVRPVEPIPNPGSAVFYPAATGFERALIDVDAERLIRIQAEVIRAQWNPWQIAKSNIPFLAWATGVNIWEGDYWSESTQRDWIAKQWLFKSLRGTPEAMRMALAQSGYTITDLIRPPQGIYASPDLTKAEWDAWIREMPEIRIYFAHREGTRGVDEWFAEDDPWATTGVDPAQTGFADQDFVALDDGWALYGREAILRQRGVDTPLNVVQYTPGTVGEVAVDYERVSTFGTSTLGVFADEDFVDDDRFVDFEEVEAKLITLRLDRTYSHDASNVSLTTVVPGQEPLTPRYERSSDIGDAGPWMYADDEFATDNFVDRVDGGERMLADRIYLLDPDVVEPMMRGISFADLSRVGIPPFTAEVQVDLHTFDYDNVAFADDVIADDSFVGEEDDSHRERAMRAIVGSMALRDTVLVSFAPKRPLEAGDFIPANAEYDDWIAESL